MTRYSGSIYRVGDWRLVRRHGTAPWYRYARIDGRTVCKSLGVSDFDEAKRKLQEWCELLGQPSKYHSDTMGDIMRSYLCEQQSKVSYKNTKMYSKIWLIHAGQMNVREACSYAHQEALIKRLALKGLKPSTINAIVGTGRSAVYLAYRRQLIDFKPPFIQLPLHEQPLMGRVVSMMEIRMLLKNSPPHLKMYILLLMSTLGRPSAVIQLTWSQVDLDTQQIALNPIGRVQNKKFRPLVMIPDTLMSVLLSKKERLGRIVKVGDQQIDYIRRSWRKARLLSGLSSEVTLYSFRHTVARHLRRANVPMDQIQYQLGHKKLGVSERYLNCGPEDFRDVTLAIDAFLRRVLEDPETGLPICAFAIDVDKSEEESA